MFDWIFAFVHLILLLGVLGYAFVSLAQGNVLRFLTLILLLAAYYLLVLHKAVKKEIARRRRPKA
jgi:uncharacterized membrane protein YfcA